MIVVAKPTPKENPTLFEYWLYLCSSVGVRVLKIDEYSRGIIAIGGDMKVAMVKIVGYVSDTSEYSE